MSNRFLARLKALEARVHPGWVRVPCRLQANGPGGPISYTWAPPIDPNMPRLNIPAYDSRWQNADGTDRTDIPSHY